MDAFEMSRRLLNGEDWPSFGEPTVADIRRLQRATASIAVDPLTSRPIFRLDWLAGLTVVRCGQKVYANIIAQGKVQVGERLRGNITNLTEASPRLLGKPAAEVISALWEPIFEEKTILVPRWGFRQLLPDPVAKPEWERESTSMTSLFGVSYLSAFPEGGMYRELPGSYGTVAVHERERACCRRNEQDGLICYGRYLAPTWQHVEAVKEKWRDFVALPKLREPWEAPTAAEVESFARDICEKQDAGRTKYFKDMAEGAKDYIRRGPPLVDIGAAYRKREERELAS